MNDELLKKLEAKAAKNRSAGNISVVYRIPDELYGKLKEYRRLYNHENGADISLNKMIVEFIERSLKDAIGK
jgi:hypothetical protein